MPKKKKKAKVKKKNDSAREKARKRIIKKIQNNFKETRSLKSITEDEIQQDFIAYIRYKYPEVLFTANGNFKGMNTIGYAKKMGYLSGVPDIAAFEPRGKYPGIFFEMKKIDGDIRKHQEDIIEKLGNKSYATAICYTLKDACEVMDDYMSLGRSYK